MAADFPRGALLAKVDIKSAYRLVPVHPHDRPLLAVQFRDDVYIDAVLLFGLRSAPKIFNALADDLAWILEQAGIQHLFHYLDDFIIVGPPDSQQCGSDLALLESVCAELGVPLAAHKKEGATPVITFLGIEVDTLAGDTVCLLHIIVSQFCILVMLQPWWPMSFCQSISQFSFVVSVILLY